MCRMYASVGPRGPPAEELLAFRGLCTTGCGGPHGDGWGLAAFAAPREPAHLGRSLLAAARDPAFEGAAREAARFPAVGAHLRMASSGSKTLANTQPFLDGPWAFGHNGTIRGSYEEKVAPGEGLNDSRALFARLRARLREGPEAALRGAVREVKDLGVDYSSLTVLLTDGATLYAARDVRERPDEYAMRWRREGARWVFCQEPILPGAWEELPNGHLAVAGPSGVRVAPL